MTEAHFVNSLHINQRKAYWQLKAQAQEDLKAKLDLAVEALLPLAKIAKAWESGSFEDAYHDRIKAGLATLVEDKNEVDLLTFGDAFKAQDFFKTLGIDI